MNSGDKCVVIFPPDFLLLGKFISQKTVNGQEYYTVETEKGTHEYTHIYEYVPSEYIPIVPEKEK
jgi:hypothetical protein